MSAESPAPSRPGPTWAALAEPVHRIQRAELLDRPAEVLARVADVVVGPPRARSVLRGDRIGHALHPLLTDFPLGAWTSTSLLDLFGGRRARGAATGLLSFGLAAAIPTMLAGLVEWQAAPAPARRVGVVHAAVNGTAFALYSSSLLARLSGRHGRSVALGVAGGTVAILGGYLGGHLSLVWKVGTADPALLPSDPRDARRLEPPAVGNAPP